MKQLIDGKIVEFEYSHAELAEIESAQRKAEIAERHRPLSESEVSRMLITQQINTLTVDDQTALRMTEFYPVWEDLCKQSVIAEKAGYKFQFGGKLWKTRQPIYTFVSHYVPGVGTESLFERIDETHDGSEFDPIPYEGNMKLENGKYYTQNGVMFKCIRDTGNPVYDALDDLVDYVQKEVNA